MKPLAFICDEAKSASNGAKHGIGLVSGALVFADPGHVVVDVIEVRYGELRWAAVGRIGDAVYPTVFTIRDDACRLISARRASREERERYA